MAPRGSFNIQTYLEDMRADLKEDNRRLEEKVDRINGSVNSHEIRLTVVENDRKTIRWFLGVAVTSGLAWLYEFVSRMVHRP